MGKTGPKPSKIDFTKIYKSNGYDDFKILRELEPERVKYKNGHGTFERYVDIQFIQTGYVKHHVNLRCVYRGAVFDPFYPTVAGVGYYGREKTGKTDKKLHRLWASMICRCYDETHKEYKSYGAIGVTVCERWHSYANFEDDVRALPGWYEYITTRDRGKRALYHFDKDYLQQHIPREQRIYSPTTCMFIRNDINSRLSKRETFSDTNASVYNGVAKSANGTYKASIGVKGKLYFLGTYSSEIAAANVYNFVLRECFEAEARITYNDDVPYMDINDCMDFLTSRKTPTFPPQIPAEKMPILKNKCESQYIGISVKHNKNDDVYVARYNKNSKNIIIGTFTNEIAAANAHNWYNKVYGTAGQQSINTNIPYMAPAEWLQYRIKPQKYHKGEMCHIVKRQMCHIVEK